MSYKSIRAEMLLSYKIKGLLPREVFKIQTGKKVVLVSKKLMGKISLTGKMTGSPDGQVKIPKKKHKKSLENQGIKFLMAGVKGLEPSTFCVTGRRSNQTELHPQWCKAVSFITDSFSLVKYFLLFYLFQVVTKQPSPF